MSVCNVVTKQKAMKAIWDSDLIEVYNHCTKTNWVS